MIRSSPRAAGGGSVGGLSALLAALGPLVRACLHGSSNPFRAGGSGSARARAAAGDVRDRMAALVPPARPAVAGTQVPRHVAVRALLGGLRLPGGEAGGRSRW